MVLAQPHAEASARFRCWVGCSMEATTARFVEEYKEYNYSDGGGENPHDNLRLRLVSHYYRIRIIVLNLYRQISLHMVLHDSVCCVL